MRRWMSMSLVLSFGLALLALPAVARAQEGVPLTADQTREANLDAYIELMRADVRSQKVAIIAQVMQFSPQEDAAFWPVYRDYAAKLQAINDERLKLTKEYADTYTNLSDATADRLLKGVLDLQARRQALTVEYYDKLKTALSPKTAARVIQVEHQILLLLDLQIAASLPIVE